MFPSGLTGWRILFGLILGALVGWALHPAIWMAFGPARFVAFVCARAALHSGFTAEAPGGPLGYARGTWSVLSGLDTEQVRSCVLSGFFAARMTSTAIILSPKWWTFAVPVHGWAVWLWMWRAGEPSQAFADELSEGAAWGSMGPDDLSTGLVWRAISSPATVLLGWAAYRKLA